MLVASFLKSQLFMMPGNLRVVVMFDIPWAIRWLMSANDGFWILRFYWQILLRALFSMEKVAWEDSMRPAKVRTELYGSTTTSELPPLVEPGKMEKLTVSLSEYSSLSFSIRSVPRPEPVPPPIECKIWKAERVSQSSTCLRT